MNAPLTSMGDPERHFWLTRSVARVSNVSLTEAMACDLLTARDYTGMVTRCRMCALVPACETWLAGTCSQHETAPPYCLNAEIFSQLAAQIGAPMRRTAQARAAQPAQNANCQPPQFTQECYD